MTKEEREQWRHVVDEFKRRNVQKVAFNNRYNAYSITSGASPVNVFTAMKKELDK